MVEEIEDIERLESRSTVRTLPVGWVILFWGLILWGIYYFVSYTPAISGWSQGQEYEESVSK